MKLCEQVINKEEILISEIQIPKPSKFSLKERKFHHPKIQPSLSKRSWNCDSGSNRFVSFMEKHNNLLAKKCTNQNLIQTEGEEQFLGCIDINCQGEYTQSFFSKMAVKHYPTFSTLSSSNASELATTQQFSQRERQGKFKINTKSILSQLIKEGYCTPERKRVSSEYEPNKSKAGFQGEREKSASLYDSKDGFQISSGKRQKISLRKKNLALISENQLNRKESVSYQQLSNPLSLGSQIQDLAQSNLKVSIVIKEYPSFSRTGPNENSKSDCYCQPCCKWIDRWLACIEDTTVGHMKRVAVDEKTLTQIDKDTPRTQMNKLFSTPFYRDHLRDVLIGYSSLNPKIGYVQGMNFIASAIIYHTKKYSISSRIFNSLMIQKQFQSIYEDDFAVLTQLTQHLYQEIKKYSKTLFIQINQCGIELEVFARGWYLSMLGTFVPLEWMHLVVDKFFRKGIKGINQILLTLLIYLKQELMEVEYDEMAMKLSNSWLCERGKTINWEELVGCSENIMINPVPL